ncbi:MAG: hypothetical protein JW768_16660 [Chitinispirillaceae bacterium]|nr:hypothetical protein [Chitinispirillaceae bacterium]
MQPRKTSLIAAILLVPVIVAVAEIVSATSDPFTFPLIDSIKQKQKAMTGYSFSAKGFSAHKRSLELAWSVGQSVQADKGAITLFTLHGKTVQTIEITKRSGSIVWNVPGNFSLSGVLIARLSYGGVNANLKLLICR